MIGVAVAVTPGVVVDGEPAAAADAAHWTRSGCGGAFGVGMADPVVGEGVILCSTEGGKKASHPVRRSCGKGCSGRSKPRTFVLWKSSAAWCCSQCCCKGLVVKAMSLGGGGGDHVDGLS